MPSMRRIRFFGVVVFCTVVYILYLTSNSRHTRNSDFYSKTKQALDRNTEPHHPHAPLSGEKSGNDDEAVAANLASRLKDAERAAKDSADAKSPKPEGIHVVVDKAQAVVQDVLPSKAGAGKNEAAHKDESIEEYNVDQELNRLLKKSPIIIFSKTYCPHSKRAKDILLNKYNIVPAPFVVELDEHPQGALLQNKLAEMTGRRTVPNVIVNGKSIGGGDDVAELDHTKKLVAKIKSLAGKKMQKVEETS